MNESKYTWSPMETGTFVPVAVALGLSLLVIARSKGFVPVLDHANLAFHEAGHLIFGILGQTMGLYGGTLGQLVFPTVALVAFWHRKESVSFVFSGIWVCENFLNIARYMADARAQVLPLVGGGDHDWTRILSRWGVLHLDTKLAGLLSFLSWVGMLALVGWLAWRWRDESSNNN